MRTLFPKLTIFIMVVIFNQMLFSGCATSVKKAEPFIQSEDTEVAVSPPADIQETPVAPADADIVEQPDEKTVAYFNPTEQYYYYIEAQLQRKRGHTDKAIYYLKKTIENDPESLYLQRELANLYLRKNDKQSALKLVEKMIGKEPAGSVESLIIYGRLKQELKQTDGAKKAYEKVLADDPKQKEIYLLLGGLYFDEDDLTRAFQVYERLIQNFPEAYAGHFFLGKIYEKRSDLDAAEREFQKTLDIEPDLEEPRFELLNIYDTRGEKEKAIRIYEEMLEENPDNIRAMMGLAYYYHKIGLSENAEELLTELGERSATEPGVIRNLVQFYIDQKQYEPAVVILEGMLKGAPDNSDIHYAAGITFDGMQNEAMAIKHFSKVTPDSRFYQNAVVHISFLYQEQDRVEDAILFLENVIREIPDNPEFMLYLGTFYEETEDFEASVDILEKGLEIDPDNPRIYFRLGVVYDKWGRKEDCIEAMKESIRLDPENANALNYLGYTYADLEQDLDEAERLVIEALKYKPDDGYIIDSLGWVYFKKGLFNKAVKTLEKAVRLVPDDPIILEHLGDAYLKTNDRKRAIEFYERSLLKKEDNGKEFLEKKIQELTEEEFQQ
ncbi:tetratricopeptide repeat protein [Desulfonema magnum]|nr:tetratricopeptide repeat protein [Desulfonema magnum]